MPAQPARPGPPGLFIQEVTTAVPSRSLSREHAAEFLGTSCAAPRTARLLRRLVRLSGIQKRHLAVLDYQMSDHPEQVLYRAAALQPHGPGMTIRTEIFEACAAPLLRSTLAALPPRALEQVRQLVTVSCTHASAPGLERPIWRHSAVPRNVQRWNLGFMGCSGALAALRMIERQGGAAEVALIVACEVSSLHFQYTDQIDQMTANVLFADGAAALLLGPEAGPVRVVGTACAALPESAGEMTWQAGDFGLRLTLSPELPDTLGAALPAAVDDFLARHGATRSNVHHWLVHPGGPQILDAAEAALGLPAGTLDLSRGILREFGNMSSPTILFILERLLVQRGRGRVVLLAFGPGLTIEMALLDVTPRHDNPAGFDHNGG